MAEPLASLLGSSLTKSLPPGSPQTGAIVRAPKAARLAEQGVQVRQADYREREAWSCALHLEM